MKGFFLLSVFQLLSIISNAQDSLFIQMSNDTVYVCDFNVWEQCGFLRGYNVEIVDSIINVTQIDTAEDMTTCYGYHNFIVPVVGLTDGDYRVDIYRDCLYEDIKFIGLIRFNYNISGVEINEPTHNQFILYNAYPNPFNPSTKIKYTIPNSEQVLIKVYDILGKELKTLLNEYQHAGTYELEFDASSLPRGVYFYRIIGGKKSNVRKMVLLR